MIRRLGLATVVTLLLLPTPAALALIPVKSHSTFVITQVDSTTVTYSGQVTAKTKNKGGLDKATARRAARRCIKSRHVFINLAGRFLGETSTDENGRWSITGEAPTPGSDLELHISRDIRRGVLCGVTVISP